MQRIKREIQKVRNREKKRVRKVKKLKVRKRLGEVRNRKNNEGREKLNQHVAKKKKRGTRLVDFSTYATYLEMGNCS